MTGHQEPHVTNGTATAASNPSDAGWRGPVSGAAGGRHCWCGEPLAPTGVVTPTFRLLRCAACGTHAIDPPPIDSDAQSGDFYTAYYSSHAPAHAGANGVPRGRWSRYWRVVQKVPDLDRAGQQAIDFGSGEGRLCFELSEAGWQDVAGLDVSRARVARARQLYPSLRFFDCAIEETPLPHGGANLCVMDNVIEHLTNPRELLAVLRRYLRPGGRIVVITPNMESGHFRFLGRRWTPELAPHAHVFLFTARSLEFALRSAGYRVAHTGTFHDDPYPLREWTRRLWSGDVKGALWRAHQELGALYGRVIDAGPMVFAVAEAPATSATAKPRRRAHGHRDDAVAEGGMA